MDKTTDEKVFDAAKYSAPSTILAGAIVTLTAKGLESDQQIALQVILSFAVNILLVVGRQFYKRYIGND